MGLAWRWTSRQQVQRPLRGFEDTMPDTLIDSSMLTGDSQRFEVCPPSLLDDHGEPTRSGLASLLPRLSGVREWLQTGWSQIDTMAADGFSPKLAIGSQRLRTAQAAFMAAMGDLAGAAANDLAARARAARTLRDLWHLRNELFTMVAQRHCESAAHDKLADLNACFPVRPQPLSRLGGSGTIGGFGSQQPRP